jgi:solute:Na+ symporter, SSS family
MSITMLIVVLYLILVTAIGLYVSRFNKSLDDYFVAGRRLTLWFNTNTLAATAIGSGTTMGICGMAYSSGIAAGWILVGFSVGFVLIAVLVAKKMYRLNAITLPDVIESRFDKRTRDWSTLLVTIQYVGIAAAQVVALGTITNVLLGIGFTYSVLLCGGVMILYTMLGGLLGVAVTDVFQLILNLIGVMIILPILGFKATGGFTGIFEALPATHFDMGAYGFAVTLGFFSWIIPQGFLSQELWIRIFASKDENVARNSTLMASIAVYIPYMISVVCLGLIGATLYPEIGGDSVLPTLITKLTSPVIQGVLLASLIAAVMSCADSVLLVASSNLVKDFYQGILNKKIKPEQMVRASRIGVAAVGVLSIILALFMGNIIKIMQLMATPYAGALFPIVIALFYWKRATSKGAFLSIIITLIVSIVLIVTKINILGLDPVVIAVIVGTLTLIIGSLATKEDAPIKA